jgi:hypothetical protein
VGEGIGNRLGELGGDGRCERDVII